MSFVALKHLKKVAYIKKKLNNRNNRKRPNKKKRRKNYCFGEGFCKKKRQFKEKLIVVKKKRY